MRRSTIALLAMLTAFVALVPRNASAACTLCTCTGSATAVAFGTYRMTDSAPNDSQGSVSVSCSLGGLLSLGVSYTISLSPGTGSFSSRSLIGPSSTLQYNLYTDSQRTTVWGDGTGSTQTVSDSYTLSLLGAQRSYTVYGRIPAGQNIASGSYVDTITVTVAY